MSIKNSIELAEHWKQHLRENKADTLKSLRSYRKKSGKYSHMSGYYEGRAFAYGEAIKILGFMVEYQEMFDGQ